MSDLPARVEAEAAALRMAEREADGSRDFKKLVRVLRAWSAERQPLAVDLFAVLWRQRDDEAVQVDSLIELAQSARLLSRPHEALEALERAMREADPQTRVSAAYAYGQVLRDQGRLEESLRQFAEVEAASGDASSLGRFARYERARLLADLGAYDHALEALHPLTAKDDELGRAASFDLAQVALRSGRTQRAKALFLTELLKEDGRSKDHVLLWLASISERAGEDDEARRWYELLASGVRADMRALAEAHLRTAPPGTSPSTDLPH